MGLSMRFASSTVLRNAAENRPPLVKGTHGRAVHLVQMALMDLGYPMPISTKKPLYSPDGIFGEETFRVVKQFQKDQGLKVDGVVGKATLAELDRFFARPQHRIRLHFRSIALTDVPFPSFLAAAQLVYLQYGILPEFASGQSLRLTPEQQDMFDKIDQECDWILTDGEYDKLHSLGQRVPSTEIVVYFVKELEDAGGCGGHKPNRPAATVSSDAAQWDMAHEVGHVLLTKDFRPRHLNDVRNLMHKSVSTFNEIPVLTHKQVEQIRKSDCCKVN